MCRGERVQKQRYKEREKIVSRTDDLRKGGATERVGSGGGSGAPFVKWSDDYAWFEGVVTGTFETKYGLAATIDVQSVCEDGLDMQGRDEDGNQFKESVRAGEAVNLGLNSATLEGKITPEDKGNAYHVAFEGWENPRGGGNRYRLFAVVELTERSAEGLDQSDKAPPQTEWPDEATSDAQAEAHVPPDGDDGLPF